MQRTVFLQKISWLCCRSWDRHSAGHSNVNPLFKECRPTSLSELSLFFSCCVPLPSWLVEKHFHLQILTHYGSCEGSDSILFRASQTTQVWSSGAHWHSGPLTDDASVMHNTHFWTQKSNFSPPWLSSSGPGTHLSGRSMEAAAMQWTRAVHIDLVHIFQSLPVYCNHLISCGNTSGQASECHYNLFYQS